MREIKFKIYKDGKEYDRCMVGATNKYKDDKWSCPLVWMEDSKQWVHIINGNICQYTGLKDKNNVEIYEGDIIEYLDMKFTVAMDQYGVLFLGDGNKNYPNRVLPDYVEKDNYIADTGNYEVKGNIYQKEKTYE